MSALAAFIDSELATRGWSNERAAAEATKRGHYLTGETVRKARRDLYKEQLPLATIAALAEAFNVRPEKIQQLDRQRWDLAPAATSDVEAAILGDPTIPDRDKRLMLEIYRSRPGAGGNGRSPGQPGQAPGTALG